MEKLTPQAQWLLDFVKEKNFPPARFYPLLDARKDFETFIQNYGGKPIDVNKVTNIVVPLNSKDINLRIYSDSDKTNQPIIFYFHGGGWLKGSLNTHDRLCRQLAKHAECLVISIDYSLSPENRFPIALNEGKEALHWIIENASQYNGNPQLICLAGDSAGGNLAAALAQYAADQSIDQVKLQYLIYPVLDSTFTSGSCNKFADGYLLTKDAMEFYFESYTTDGLNRKDPLVSPLFNAINEKLAPAILVAAECDPLRDDSFHYANLFKKKGLLIHFSCIPGVLHGFIQIPGIFPEADPALIEDALRIKDYFSVLA